MEGFYKNSSLRKKKKGNCGNNFITFYGLDDLIFKITISSHPFIQQVAPEHLLCETCILAFIGMQSLINADLWTFPIQIERLMLPSHSCKDTRQITLNFIRHIGAKSTENSESRNEEFRFCMKK